MHKMVIAGNWKMNLNHIEGATVARALVDSLADREFGCEIILIPPFTTIPAVLEAVSGSNVAVGAQDLYFEEEGAFTGEISGRMLRSLGCKYVLVGHSERRHVLGEGGEILARKVRAALRAGLFPIFCVGELLAEREADRAEEIVVAQLGECLEGLSSEEISKIIIAYEPVWAIGTGKTATRDDASHMHGVIRKTLGTLFGKDISSVMIILYGGSVKPGNASDLLSDPEIDGVLVGGASLGADSFSAIISSTCD